IAVLKKTQTGSVDERNSYVQLQLQLEQLFDIEKIHTITGLKLSDVAERLNVRPSVLSTLINTHLKTSFFEMVNNYRVKEAKQLLLHQDYQQYKIAYIAELSGFNSRASFFRVFK